MAQVMQPEPAELRIGAERPPASDEAGLPPAFGVARKQERVRVSYSGQRLDQRPRGLSERYRARTGFRVRQIDCIGPNVAPAQIEHFAAAASSQHQQPDRGAGLGPFDFVGAECAPEPRQLVRVEEPGDVGSSGSSRCRDRGCCRACASPIPRPGTSSRAVSRRRGWPRRAGPCWPRRTTRPRAPGRCGRAASCRTRAGCGP